MKYPFRFEGSKIGDTVYAVTMDDEGTRFIDKVTIAGVQDNSYHVKVVNGMFTNELERDINYHLCSIGYWLEEFSIGHAMYFGEDLFLTLEEAMEDLANS